MISSDVFDMIISSKVSRQQEKNIYVKLSWLLFIYIL